MKIAITATGSDLNSQVDPRFGRCQYFIFIDPKTLKFESVQNPNISALSGAGIQTAQLVANKDCQVLLTGNVGPNAFQTLQAAGVEVIIGVSGIVKDVVEKYKKGEFQTTGSPNVPSHFGTQPQAGIPGTGASAGPTPGIGRGSGRGRMGGNRPGAGPAGSCICPSCGAKVAHQVGAPCYQQTCPKCGAKMVRE